VSVRLTVRDESITKGMKRYAEEKAERLKKFFDGVTGIEVILDTEGMNKRAEIVLSVAGGEGIAVHAEHEQMNAAIDLAMDRAERSIVKHKEKVRDHRGNGGEAVAPTNKDPDSDLESYQDIVEKTEFPGE